MIFAKKRYKLNIMENVLKYLFGIGVIVWCLFALGVNSSLIGLLLLLVIFIIVLVGGIYAVGKALVAISKYRKEVEKEEINEIND